MTGHGSPKLFEDFCQIRPASHVYVCGKVGRILDGLSASDKIEITCLSNPWAGNGGNRGQAIADPKEQRMVSPHGPRQRATADLSRPTRSAAFLRTARRVGGALPVQDSYLRADG